MKLLLAFVFCCVLVGLYTDRLDGRTYAIVVIGAVGVTCLYFFTTRFMT